MESLTREYDVMALTTHLRPFLLFTVLRHTSLLLSPTVPYVQPVLAIVKTPLATPRYAPHYARCHALGAWSYSRCLDSGMTKVKLLALIETRLKTCRLR